MTKAPTPTEKSKKQRDNIKTTPKTLITQRFWNTFSILENDFVILENEFLILENEFLIF